MLDTSKTRLKRVACYLPLATIGLDLLWIIVLFLAFIFAVGDEPYVNTPGKLRLLDWISMVPAAAGLLFGLVAILLRLPSKTLDWICLIAGSLGCAGLVLLCMRGFW